MNKRFDILVGFEIGDACDSETDVDFETAIEAVRDFMKSDYTHITITPAHEEE